MTTGSWMKVAGSYFWKPLHHANLKFLHQQCWARNVCLDRWYLNTLVLLVGTCTKGYVMEGYLLLHAVELQYKFNLTQRNADFLTLWLYVTVVIDCCLHRQLCDDQDHTNNNHDLLVFMMSQKWHHKWLHSGGADSIILWITLYLRLTTSLALWKIIKLTENQEKVG